MQLLTWMSIALLVCTLSTVADNTGTDPVHKYVWGENVGWANAASDSTNNEVTVHYNEEAGGWLSGFVWCENIGWVVMGSVEDGPYANTTTNNWGVNLAANGELSGYAWGENVGWINFGAEQCDAIIDTATGQFSGHVWGENIGWLKFKGDLSEYGLRSMAFYTQAHGTPNWWLIHYGVSEEYDAGDGVPAYAKYIMDVDPTVSGNYLSITSAVSTANEYDLFFSPASTRRYYTLIRSEGGSLGVWSNVTGQVNLPGTGGSHRMQDTNATTRAFYRVKVTVTP